MVTPVLALCLDFSGAEGSLFARSCLGRTCPSRAWCDVSRVPILGREASIWGHESDWLCNGCIFWIYVDLRILYHRLNENNVYSRAYITKNRRLSFDSNTPLPRIGMQVPRVLNRMDRPAPVGPPGKLLLSAVSLVSEEGGRAGRRGLGREGKGLERKAGGTRQDKRGERSRGQSGFPRPRKRLRRARAPTTCRARMLPTGYGRRRGSSDPIIFRSGS